MSEFAGEPKDPIDDYDAKHGHPEATPNNPGGRVSEADQWGEKLNPVRETPLAGTNLKEAGK